MKITNFKPKSQLDFRKKYWVATVEVQTGVLFWKKSKEREVITTLLQNIKETSDSWRFVDTGEYCPVSVERLAWVYLTKEELEVEK